MDSSSSWNNPFRAPLATGDAPTQYADLRPIIVQWEKLRFVYNGVLAVEVLILLTAFAWTGKVIFDISLVEELVVAAVAANVCYFAGPLLDVYWTAFARFRAPMILLLFPMGLLLAMALSPLVLISIVGAKL